MMQTASVRHLRITAATQDRNQEGDSRNELTTTEAPSARSIIPCPELLLENLSHCYCDSLAISYTEPQVTHHGQLDF